MPREGILLAVEALVVCMVCVQSKGKIDCRHALLFLLYLNQALPNVHVVRQVTHFHLMALAFLLISLMTSIPPIGSSKGEGSGQQVCCLI